MPKKGLIAPPQEREWRVEINYECAGPTIADFHASQAEIRGILGPIGSGKSVACAIELFRLSCEQSPYNGVRYSKWAVIRNTYPELRTTTLRTFQDWFPSEIAPVVFDSPIRCKMQIPLPDDTWVHAEFLFVALDDPSQAKKTLKSLELTGCWINEASEIHKDIFELAFSRTGRYPPKKWGGATRPCMIMDTNAMDDDHWWYHLAELMKPANMDFFRQPPAVNPDPSVENGYVINPYCENLENHEMGEQYWLRLVPGKSREWIDVWLRAQYGSIVDGRRVYPEYNDAAHYKSEKPILYENLPIWVGWDYGRTPAAVIAQVTPNGRLVLHGELMTDNPLDLGTKHPKMGVRAFAHDIVRPYIHNHYHGAQILSVGDPSGATPESDERSAEDHVISAGFNVRSARSNLFTPRREAVAMFLTRMVDGQSGFQITPACPVLRKGFNGRYHYRKMKIPGEDMYSDVMKNAYSHPHDALQYIALEATTQEEFDKLTQSNVVAIGGRRRRRSSRGSWRV